MKFPKRLRHRGKGKVLATIYKRPDFYRVYWGARVDGKPRSQMKDFATFSAAKREADKAVPDLARGIASPLSPEQASDAVAAFERLQHFFQSTGRRVSLRAAVVDYCEAAGKLHGRTLTDAVDGFLSTVATVKRVDLKEAVEQSIASREPKTVAKDGKRLQLSPRLALHRRPVASAFRGHFSGARRLRLGQRAPQHLHWRSQRGFVADA